VIAVKVVKTIGGLIKVLAALVVLIVGLGVILVVVVVGKGVDKANQQSKRVTPLMERVHLGATEAQVRRQLGKPDSTQRSTDRLGRTDYWYYGTLSTKASWQLVFTNGKLTARNRD